MCVFRKYDRKLTSQGSPNFSVTPLYLFIEKTNKFDQAVLLIVAYQKNSIDSHFWLNTKFLRYDIILVPLWCYFRDFFGKIHFCHNDVIFKTILKLFYLKLDKWLENHLNTKTSKYCVQLIFSFIDNIVKLSLHLPCSHT